MDQGKTTGDAGALPPAAIALACETAGVSKAERDAVTLFVLGILAGAFIAFGGVFMTIVLTGSADLPYGVARLLGGLAFSLGLILVIVGGAELFTGDTLMIVAHASGRISLLALLRAWFLVYAGNIVGALGMVLFVFLAGLHGFNGGAVGNAVLAIASAKAGLATVQLFFLSVLCNVLVCLAVWMAFAGRSVVDKVVVIVPPIAAFVAAGFEHSIANLYLLPLGLAIKTLAAPEFWQAVGQGAGDYPALTLTAILHNIVVSTIGNLIGGSLLVGVVYWFVYLRKPAM